MPLTRGIIDLFNVPDLASLVRSVTVPTALANPYSGSGTLTALDRGIPAYGLKWSAQSAPAGAGLASRSIVFYELSWLSLTMRYILADASDFKGDSVLTGAAEGWVLFETGQPTFVDYDISSGWTVNFAWVIAP
jgi:hypothetical protein